MVVCLRCSLFLSSSFALFFPYNLTSFLNVMPGLPSLYFLCIYYRILVTLRFIYNIPYIQQSILSWWLLKFKHILKALDFYYPVHIFCIYCHILHLLFCVSLNKFLLILLPVSFNLYTSFKSDGKSDSFTICLL